MTQRTKRATERTLAQIHTTAERQYKGDYGATDQLADLATAIARAELTDKQKTAIRLCYVNGRTQREAGATMGVTRRAVGQFIDAGIRRISVTYERWAELDAQEVSEYSEHSEGDTDK